MKVATQYILGPQSQNHSVTWRDKQKDPINRPKKCTIINYNNNTFNDSISRSLHFPMGWPD